MTREEIKDQYSMMDVVEKYGLQPDRRGFLHCPFHAGDHTASLKIYPDSFYCFGCHAHGDIFSFVEMMEDCSFKDAFRILGGDSGPLSDAAITRIAKRKRERKRYQKRLNDALDGTVTASEDLHEAEETLKSLEPMSDEWCAGKNDLVKLQAVTDEALTQLLDLQHHESG
jgi:DNA primase